MPANVSSRRAYLALFNDRADAVEFEERTLNAGAEFLPACARTVLNGGKPSGAYWAWLAEQYEAEQYEAASTAGSLAAAEAYAAGE